MRVTRKDLLAALEVVLETDNFKSAVFFAPRGAMPKVKVKATRKLQPHRRDPQVDVILTLGRLSYSEKAYSRRSLKRYGTVHPLLKPFTPKKRKAKAV